MSVLLTGISGFIGSELGQRLVEKGYTVHGLIRHTSGRMLDLNKDYMDKVRLVQGDLREYHSVRLAIRESNPEFIVHLGAVTPVRLSFDDPFSSIDVNFRGTVNVIQAALGLAPNLKRFVMASTMEVYGWQDRQEPFSEDLPLHPASPYAVSKAAADMYVRMINKVSELNYTVLRPCNSYGRKNETRFIVEYLITSMLKKERVYIGTPKSIRDLMHVDDHVAAYLRVMEDENANQQTFNVGTGHGITMRELADMVAQLTDYRDTIVEGYPPGYPARPAFADPLYLVLNPSKIEARIGWKATVTLQRGLSMAVEYWRKRLGN
jgi:nucleoside-diphosphate-sugar epimerase